MDIVKKKIESYRQSKDKRPLVINFKNQNSLSWFYQSYFSIPKINVYDTVKKDGDLPTLANIYESLDKCKETICVVEGLGSLLKLHGAKELHDSIHLLLSTSYSTKFLIVLYQCENQLAEKVPKIKENIVLVDDKNSIPSSLVFVETKYRDIIEKSCDIKQALMRIEKTEGEKIYVSTDYNKNIFSNSLIQIHNCTNPYDILYLRDHSVIKVPKSCGTDKQWAHLLKLVKSSSIDETLSNTINVNNILTEIKEWNSKPQNDKWILYFCLKYKSIKLGNWAIDYALANSKDENDFVKKLFYSIDDLEINDNSFWKKYEDRKKAINDIFDDAINYQYCAYIQYKNEKAIYYLTDNTETEKKTLIDVICKNREKYNKKQLMSVLEKVYSDLYDYLVPYDLGNDLLTDYFNEYKYMKITNYLSDSFKDIVNKQATERSFKKLLLHRYEVLDDMKCDNSIVYFVDALGVEFLSYIERKCLDMNLSIRTTICQANLPTITAKNTEFKEFFANKSINVIDEKRLDSLKHDGKDDYDYSKTTLPIHVVEELNIINRCLEDIKKKIRTQVVNKAIIVSDHGATRLAILNDDMVKEDVESTGEHGGRVCKDVPGIRDIPNAIKEDGYYILCDYNAFKGGRVGKVEMHGGGTLEEVVVPVIEIVDRVTSVEIKVIDKIVKFSFKKNATLRFYSSQSLRNVSVKFEGSSYNTSTQDNKSFEVELPSINKSGDYTFEVWSDGNLISANNIFTAQNEVGSTNDLWG